VVKNKQRDFYMGLPEDFLPTMQRSVAVTAIGPSSLRNQGNAGVINAAREFLAKCDLGAFRCHSEEEFKSKLDNLTKDLIIALPKGARSWGAARKAMNLFLRDALYNQYLAQNYRLHSIENWLEIPLDSLVAKGLKKENNRQALPAWPGLKRLSSAVSAQFQLFALDVAIRKGFARVHLDIYIWLKER
jgi:hypothetical protein